MSFVNHFARPRLDPFDGEYSRFTADMVPQAMEPPRHRRSGGGSNTTVIVVVVLCAVTLLCVAGGVGYVLYKRDHQDAITPFTAAIALIQDPDTSDRATALNRMLSTATDQGTRDAMQTAIGGLIANTPAAASPPTAATAAAGAAAGNGAPAQVVPGEVVVHRAAPNDPHFTRVR